MEDNNKVIEPSLKVGSDTQVGMCCSPQSAESSEAAGINEVVVPNPLGSVTPDKQQLPTKFLRPKEFLNISTFNIRSGREAWKIQELAQLMDQFGISIVAIQEHRRVHKEEIKYEHIDNHLLITSSAWRNQAQAAVGGVGFLLNKKAESALCETISISGRILKATFSGNPECNLIAAYSPTNCKQYSDDSDQFYDRLRTTIDQIPPHNLMVILGDMNAKISQAHVRYAHDKRTDENGSHLIELACEKSLIIVNNNLLKKQGKRWTFQDPKGERYQLDYVLVNSKWKNSIMNVEPYSSFASVGSDHRIVTIKLRLSIRAPKATPPKKRYDWKLLKHDDQLCSNFSIELKGK